MGHRNTISSRKSAFFKLLLGCSSVWAASLVSYAGIVTTGKDIVAGATGQYSTERRYGVIRADGTATTRGYVRTGFGTTDALAAAFDAPIFASIQREPGDGDVTSFVAAARTSAGATEAKQVIQPRTLVAAMFGQLQQVAPAVTVGMLAFGAMQTPTDVPHSPSFNIICTGVGQ